MTDPQQAIKDALKSELHNHIPQHVRLSILYKTCISLTAISVLLLPLIYILSILAAGYATLLHAAQIPQFVNNPSSWIEYTLWLIILGFGISVFILMLKPFLAPQLKETGRVLLDKGSEPVLENYIEALCKQTRTPYPHEIYLTNDAEIRVKILPGFNSIFKTKLRLYLGLPLFAQLPANELTGILAMKLGLYSRGSSLRLRLLILIINQWLKRVSVTNDSWDTRLNKSLLTLSNFKKANTYLTKTLIWIIRRLLWVLMIIGKSIAYPIMRHRVYDADSYATHIIGKDTFNSLFESKSLIQAAKKKADKYITDNFATGVLPNNQPKMVSYFHERLKEDEKNEAIQNIDELTQHPALKRRLHKIRKQEAQGNFKCTLPAAQLFINLNEVSEEITEFYYRETFKIKSNEVSLKANKQIFALDLERENSLRFLENYLGSSFNFTINWDFRKSSVSNLSLQHSDTHFLDLTSLQTELKEQIDEAQKKQMLEIQIIDTQLTPLLQARTLLLIKWDKVAKKWNPENLDEQEIEDQIEILENKRTMVIDTLESTRQSGSLFFNKLAVEYIKKTMSQRVKNTYRNLWYILVAQTNLADHYRDCRQRLMGLQSVVEVLKHESSDSQLPLKNPFSFAIELEKDLQELALHFNTLYYPYHEQSSTFTVREYLTQKGPAEDDRIIEIYRFSEAFLNRFFVLYNRAAGTLLKQSFDRTPQ